MRIDNASLFDWPAYRIEQGGLPGRSLKDNPDWAHDDWYVIRGAGEATAVIPTADGDGLEAVFIEAYDDPESRARWDGLNTFEFVGAVKREVEDLLRRLPEMDADGRSAAFHRLL